MTVSKLVHQVYFDNGVSVVPVSPTDKLPVTGDWLTAAQYVANTQTDALTDAQLRASPIDVNVAGSADPTWTELFRYATPDDPALPSGAPITVHPVLNTEPNVIDSGWIRTGVDGGLEKVNQRFVLGGNTALQAYVVNASDTLGNNIRNADFPFLSTEAGGVRVIGAEFFSRYYRVIIQNVSGSTCTELSARSMGGQDSPSPLVTSLDQVLNDSFPAPINRSVTVGRQPDGDYVNSPADGSLINYTTPLGAAASIVLGPFDTDGWKAIELYIATDQVSATEGIIIEYTPDANAVSPVYYPGPKFTFSAVEVATGFVVKRLPPALDGFRLTYTNGGFAQGSVLISVELKVNATESSSVSIENQINASLSALMTRAVLGAKNDLGTYGNILRGPLGGLRTSIYEHEVETPIKPLNALSGNATSVGSGTPTQIAGSAPIGTKSIEIQADPDNTKIIYLGFNSGVTSGNAPLALNAGDARVYEVDGTPEFWAVSASGSQSIRWTYIGEV